MDFSAMVLGPERAATPAAMTLVAVYPEKARDASKQRWVAIWKARNGAVHQTLPLPTSTYSKEEAEQYALANPCPAAQRGAITL